MAAGSIAPVDEYHGRGYFLGQAGEPSLGLVHDVEQTDLDAFVRGVRKVDESELQAVQFPRVVERPPLQTLETPRSIVDEGQLSAAVALRIVGQETEGQAGAGARGAVDNTEGQRALWIFTPDAEGNPVDAGGPGMDGDIRG
jgi:hypothetical protein